MKIYGQSRRKGINSTLSIRKSQQISNIQMNLSSMRNVYLYDTFQAPAVKNEVNECYGKQSSSITSTFLDYKNNRETSSQRQSILEGEQITISCFGQITFNFKKDTIFQQTYKQVLRTCKRQLIYDIHLSTNCCQTCKNQNCPTRKKWISNIIIYDRQEKQIQQLKLKPYYTPSIIQQIHKDIPRSFPDKMFNKNGITVYQASNQKINAYQTLEGVLMLYAKYDHEVGYVQGLNLIAAAIIIHMKKLQPSFIYFKEIMTYGKLRQLYVKEMNKVKDLSYQFFNHILYDKLPDLYQHFVIYNVQPLILVPPYYLTLFASVTKIHFMHIIIDEYLKRGIIFLHKLMLSLLMYLKDQLINSGEQTLMMIGPSWIKNADIPWDKIITVTHGICISNEIQHS